HVAVPGKERAIEPPERNPVKPLIGDRDRLDEDALVLGGGEERGLERQNTQPVAARALGKEDEIVAVIEAPADRVALAAGAGAIGALDEDRALQLGEPAEDRPLRDLGLRDEAALDAGAEDRDVEIGGVVDGKERRPVARRRAADLERDAENSAAQPVIGEGKPGGSRAFDEQ